MRPIYQRVSLSAGLLQSALATEKGSEELLVALKLLRRFDASEP
jgi:hypothetical protein